VKINFLPLVLGVSFVTVAIIVFGASSGQSPVEKDPEFKKTKRLEEITAEGFEIRLQNDQDNERLELTQTLDEALAYLKRYSMHHEDLFVYDLKTDAQVASSANGSGVIYTGTNDSYEVREVDHRFEVRIGFSDYTYSNGTWKDTIFTSPSLEESEKYINEHKAYDTPLFIYDLKTGEQVASSTNG